MEPTLKPTAWLHEITEPERGHSSIFSRSADNPWSHWMKSHLDQCVYKATPLYPVPATTSPEPIMKRLTNRVAFKVDMGEPVEANLYREAAAAITAAESRATALAGEVERLTKERDEARGERDEWQRRAERAENAIGGDAERLAEKNYRDGLAGEVERLRAALKIIATHAYSRGGAVEIARTALATEDTTKRD